MEQKCAYVYCNNKIDPPDGTIQLKERIMEIGQQFLSKSKIQSDPVEYTYNGVLPNGMHHLIANTGNQIDDCEVFSEWFDNRKITLIIS